MAEWENALAIRDSVFFQMFLLAAFLYFVFRLVKPRFQAPVIYLGLGVFLVIFVGSVANIVLWTS